MFHTFVTLVTLVVTGKDLSVLILLAPFVMCPVGLVCFGVGTMTEPDYRTGRLAMAHDWWYVGLPMTVMATLVMVLCLLGILAGAGGA